MGLIIYIKTTIRQIISNAFLMAASFIVFPVILAMFMGFVQNSDSENPIKYSKAAVTIVNNDNSEESNKLVDFLKSKDMKELIKVVDEEKSEGKIIIPKGYGESLLANKKNTIVIENENGCKVIDVVKVVLDSYHSNKSSEQTIIKNIVDKKVGVSSYELMANNLLGFVITMLIYSSIFGVYTDISKNIDRRMMSLPITKNRLFIYDLICSSINILIILFAYVLFFKVTGIAFKGSLLPLSLILIIAAYVIASVSTFIGKVFNEKWGKIIGLIIFIVPIVGGEMFTGNTNIVNNFTINHYITKMINVYSNTGSISGEEGVIMSLLGIGTLLLGISLVVINLRKEVKA